jgi:hypothetical protein
MSYYGTESGFKYLSVQVKDNNDDTIFACHLLYYKEFYTQIISLSSVVHKSNFHVISRLDFEEFSLAQPEPVDHICESDVFVVAGGRPVPPICGENAGQHSNTSLTENIYRMNWYFISFINTS